MACSSILGWRFRDRFPKGGLFGLAVLATSLSLAGTEQNQTGLPFQLDRSRAALHPASPGPPVGDRLLVRFCRDTLQALPPAELAALGVLPEKELRSVPGLTVVRLAPGFQMDTALAALRARPDVLYAEADQRVQLLASPDDTWFPLQWNLQNTGQNGGTPGIDIRAPQAWDLTTGSAEVAIGILDTGLDLEHPDLVPNLWTNPVECDGDGSDDDGNGFADDCHGIDARAWRGSPQDEVGHGTHVAGIIGAAGNNSEGIAGVVWQVTLVPCRFLGEEGGLVSDAVTCLDYFALLHDRGLRLVATNNSWGGGLWSEALRDAIEAHQQRGILFVAAAGNDGHDSDQYPLFPASYSLDNVIAVAASTNQGGLASFSREGRRSVHIAAPGEDIPGTFLSEAYASFSGTSMAAPHVSGVIALLAAQDTNRSASEIRNLVLAAARREPDRIRVLTRGGLDAYGALDCSAEPIEERVLPVEPALFREIGTPVDLAVLHTSCGIPAGDVGVTVIPGGNQVELHDDGQPPDQAADDGVYTGRWTPSLTGEYLLRFSDDDGVAVRVFSGGPHNLFAPTVNRAIPSGSIATSVAIGDFNGDGRRDVAALGWRNSPDLALEVILFTGQEDGSLADEPDIFPAGQAPWSYLTCGMAVGDVNGDGRDDIVVANAGNPETPGSIGVFLQDAAGMLLPMESLPSTASHRVEAADLDADGRTDVVSAGFSETTVTVEIRYQTAEGTLAEPLLHEIPFEEEPDVLEFAAGDANGDGRQDLLVIAKDLGRLVGAPRVALALQDASGGFAEPVYLSDRLMLTFISGGALGDVDGDGSPEVVIPHGGNRAYEWKPYLSVFRPEEFGSGFSSDHVGTYDNPGGPAIADVDGDGRLDLITTAGGWESLAIHFQAPQGALFPHLLVPFPGDIAGPRGLAAGDLNGDGALDVITGDMRGGLHVGYGNPPSDEVRRTLSILIGGDGEGRVTSVPAGIDCGAVCDATFRAGTWVRLTGEAGAGSTFEGWRSRDCFVGADGRCTVVMTFNSAVQADFQKEQVRLAVVRYGSGAGRVTSDVPGIDCGDDCNEDLPRGWWVTLTATPDAGSEFAGWTGDGCIGSLDPACQVKVDRDSSLAASFKLPDKRLTVTVTGGANGEVWINGTPCRDHCDYYFIHGATVELFAFADPGRGFGGWSGACTGFGSCTLVMDQNRDVGAIFGNPAEPVQVIPPTSVTLPGPVVGIPYQGLLEAQGGVPPYTFACVKGKLPTGLSLGNDGSITGQPTKSGKKTATIEARDAFGGSGRRSITLNVAKPVRVTTSSLPKGKLGRSYSATLKAKEGRAPYSWVLVSGTLPPGLEFAAPSGTVTGIPTATGTFPITVRVIDDAGSQATKTLNLKVK